MDAAEEVLFSPGKDSILNPERENGKRETWRR